MNLHIDDGVQFGLGAFETIAVEKNKPVFLERHLQRLQHAADVSWKFRKPPGYRKFH